MFNAGREGGGGGGSDGLLFPLMVVGGVCSPILGVPVEDLPSEDDRLTVILLFAVLLVACVSRGLLHAPLDGWDFCGEVLLRRIRG